MSVRVNIAKTNSEKPKQQDTDNVLQRKKHSFIHLINILSNYQFAVVNVIESYVWLGKGMFALFVRT